MGGDLTCPDDCTNPSQGVCNGFDGTCICMPGFGGDNCGGNNDILQGKEASNTDTGMKCKLSLSDFNIHI